MLALPPPPESRLFCVYPSFWKNPGSPRQHYASGCFWTLPSRASRGQLEHPLLRLVPFATFLAKTRPEQGAIRWFPVLGQQWLRLPRYFSTFPYLFAGLSASHHTPSSISWAPYLPSLPSTSELQPPAVSISLELRNGALLFKFKLCSS